MGMSIWCKVKGAGNMFNLRLVIPPYKRLPIETSILKKPADKPDRNVVIVTI